MQCGYVRRAVNPSQRVSGVIRAEEILLHPPWGGGAVRLGHAGERGERALAGASGRGGARRGESDLWRCATTKL